MRREQVFFFTTFALFLSMLALSYFYLENLSRLRRAGRLTPELAKEMTKEEILAFLEMRERIRESQSPTHILLLVFGIDGFR